MEHTDMTHVGFLQSLPTSEQLLASLATLHGKPEQTSFLCYDIHSLRKVNRAYGRGTGDALLAAVAQWTRSYPAGTLYRIEGDQFCIVFQKTSVETVYQYALSLEARFGKVWRLAMGGQTHDVFVQASIAVLGNLKGDFKKELLELLEQALEISRKERQIILFTEEQDRLTREQVRLQMELKSCILSGMRGFHLVFQPLADPVSSTWRGLEALCRWTGPTVGPVPPGIFIEQVEEMGLIHRLGTWVLNKALETCKQLQLDSLDRFFVSVNVSALQMNHRNYVRTVEAALEENSYPAAKLQLEITESTQFAFNRFTMNSIEVLRKRGVMFALDDFGSGYSGFSNLKNLPVDMLKTDGAFIENIENDTYLQYFYYIMSETAHANNMTLIAEGIETPEQLQSVVKNGADLIQGYLFGRPMDAESINRLRGNFTTPLAEFSGWMSAMGDFKQWLYSKNAYKITPALFGIQSKCINLILDEENTEDAIDKILETVGNHFKVNRVYVFMREEGAVFSEKYEWCAEGVEPQMQLFQKIDVSSDGFYEVLQNNDVTIATKEKQLPHNLVGRLSSADQLGTVQSIAAMPMKRRDEILGFVGYDDSAERVWMPEELIILHNLCLLCLIAFAKNNCL